MQQKRCMDEKNIKRKATQMGFKKLQLCRCILASKSERVIVQIFNMSVTGQKFDGVWQAYLPHLLSAFSNPSEASSQNNRSHEYENKVTHSIGRFKKKTYQVYSDGFWRIDIIAVARCLFHKVAHDEQSLRNENINRAKYKY